MCVRVYTLNMLVNMKVAVYVRGMHTRLQADGGSLFSFTNPKDSLLSQVKPT